MLGTLRGVTGTATDWVTALEPDWTTMGLMTVAGAAFDRQYSGMVVTVTVTGSSRPLRISAYNISIEKRLGNGDFERAWDIHDASAGSKNLY